MAGHSDQTPSVNIQSARGHPEISSPPALPHSQCRTSQPGCQIPGSVASTHSASTTALTRRWQ
eukprot:scaffold650759_cov50-Prasinocladus_malaysianus.AAC.1